ncbi:MAG TPA: 7-carboxy-7-deazaguanine synthase QueE [Candidatus Polarisedimenticolia bacterium]|nr:7-carboxy-7-deazaguanine synthase QueE [Candidatus Polarisedimenticolia bacterium]
MTTAVVAKNRTASILRVNEIFHSIQGESRHAGRPCVFVRLTGCNLRCSWCDTPYAFEEGEDRPVADLLRRIGACGTRYVLVTGGEPLAQEGVHDLLGELLDGGYEVAVETGGSLDLAPLDRRVMIVMDLKCPGSGMSARNRWENLDLLKPSDEVKFVLADRVDYDWARETIARHRLTERCGLLLSPAHGVLEPRALAGWILADRLPVRLQLQIHKYIWPPDMRGV